MKSVDGKTPKYFPRVVEGPSGLYKPASASEAVNTEVGDRVAESVAK